MSGEEPCFAQFCTRGGSGATASPFRRFWKAFRQGAPPRGTALYAFSGCRSIISTIRHAADRVERR